MSLKAFGLLHCAGTSQAKAAAFLDLSKELLKIKADKPFTIKDEKNNTLFQNLCRLAAFELFEVAKELQETSAIYSNDQIKALKGKVTAFHDQFIRDTFSGTDKDQIYATSIVTKGAWIFDACQIRDKLLTLAKIAPLHFTTQEDLKKKLESFINVSNELMIKKQ